MRTYDALEYPTTIYLQSFRLYEASLFYNAHRFLNGIMRPETQALHLYAIEYTRRETESGTKTHPWPLSRGEVLRMRETGHAASQKSNTNWIKFCHEHNSCAPTVRLKYPTTIYLQSFRLYEARLFYHANSRFLNGIMRPETQALHLYVIEYTIL